MSKEDLVNTVLEGIAKVKDYIEYIDTQACLKENSSDEDTKKIVNKLFKLSKAVKDTFDEYYNNKQKGLEESQTDKSVPNNVVTNGIDSSVSSNNDEDVAQNSVEDIAQSSNDNTDDQNVSKTISTNEGAEPVVGPQDETKTSEDPEVETTVLEDSQLETITLEDSHLEATNLEDSRAENTNLEGSEVETTTSKDPQVDTTTMEDSEIETTTSKGPQVDTTTIEDSEIETTTSEGPQVDTTTSEKTSTKTVNKDNKDHLDSDGEKSDSTAKDKPMDSSPDESVTPEETVVEENKNKDDPLKSNAEKDDQVEKVDVPKDVEIKKEPPRIRLVDLNKLIDPNIRRDVQFDNSVIVLSSSEEENAPQPTKISPKKREEKKEMRRKENSSKSKEVSSKRKEKSAKIAVDLDNETEIKISDSESDDNNRKSKRLKAVQNNKTEMRKEFKIKFGKRSAEANKKSKQNAKDVRSDSSSDSETHDKSKPSRRTGRHQSRLNDGKLNSKTYVPLPLYECEKMEEIYKANKECFAVLSSEKLKSLMKSKRARKSPAGSSSDTEKSKKKKQKNNSNDEAESSKKIRNKTTVEDDVDSNEKSSSKKDKSDNECDEEESENKKNMKTKKATTSGKDVESDGENSTKKSVNASEENSNSDNEKSNKKRNKKTESSEEDSKNEANTKRKKVRWENENDKDKEDECDEEDSQKEKGVDEEQPKKKTRSKKGSAENSGEESDDGDKESQKKISILSISSGEDSDSPSISSKNDKKKKKKKKAKNFDSPAESDAETNKDTNDESDNKDYTKSKDKSKKEIQSSGDDSDVGSTKKKVKKKSSETSDEDTNNVSVTIDSSDSDDDFTARSKKKAANDNSKKKRRKKVVSDSDDSSSDKKNKTQSSDSEGGSVKSDSSSKSKKSSSGESTKKQATRRRIRNAKDSSDSDEEVSTRKNIRKVLGKSSLSETTKQAEAEEKERKARIAEKQKKYNRIFEEKKDATIDKVVVDYDEKTKEPALEVHKKIVKNLKPHQVSGIHFMYDACFESLERIKNSAGSGCILAHCMGLGKTLQVIALTHTLLTNSEKTKVEKVMVVCPINTVLNWKSEYKKWMPSNSQVDVYELATSKKNYERAYTVDTWHKDGGVLIIGYNLFRLLSNPTNKKLTKKMRTQFLEGLVDPGPDLVVCDEGHLLKNEKTNLSIAMNRIKTAKRIVLTGTPLQNNLKEYWCMVQFIKPNLLGTYKEYMNRFVNPITNGQYTDSTVHDTQLMRKRSHVLHKLLDGVVQRRDYSVLEPYLPPKQEYVLFVKLSDVQIKIYKCYMEKYARKNEGSSRTSFLFNDFQQLQRICTHPRVMLDKSTERKEKSDDEESEGSLKDFIDDDGSSAKSTSSSTESSDSDSEGSDRDRPKKSSRSRVTRAQRAAKRNDPDEDDDSDVIIEEKKEWFQEFCDGEELDNIKNSGKLSLLFEILKECEEIGDKVLVFSQSLYTLNCIEYFLAKVDEASEQDDTEKFGGYKGSWSLGLDYFRLDGSSSCDNRAYWCDSFNNPENTRARLFLISTKAGGLGINLVAANRVIIFDVSWNPSHDLQSIYRVYRFGQIKPCYIYRFVTYGAMEMKIYERQVTKQAISKRVIDEQQIDRHYNQNDLQELYKGDLEPTDRPLPMVPKDVLLGEMLQKHENIIFKYHLHQSLLENKEEEGLNEEERKAAWEEFENEKVLRKTTASSFIGQVMTGVGGIQGMSAQAINAALMNIVRRDNPTWSELQIKGIIPALVKQLQVQIEEQDMSMYQRVVQEITLMQQAKLKESLYQQQMMKLYQQQYLYQKQQQAVLGNLKFNPQQLQNLYGAQINPMNQMNAFYQGVNPYANGPSTSSNQRRRPQDVIELND